MKIELRISGFKDYIAIDETDDKGAILSTPIYLQKGKAVKLKSYDFEENKWLLTDVIFDGEKLLCHSLSDDFEWESPINELMDKDTFKPA